MKSDLRTSELILAHIKKHGPATIKQIDEALGVCDPAVSTTMHKMGQCGVLQRGYRTYAVGTVPLFRTCPKCLARKEMWRFKEDGFCSMCNYADKPRAPAGTKKHETLFPEWNEALAVNRIINLPRFTKVGVKALVKELHACR